MRLERSFSAPANKPFSNTFIRAVCPVKFRQWLLLGMVIAVSGCVSSSRTPGEQILGTWQSTLAGFTVSSTYTETDVSVDGHAGLPYTLDGDKLIIGNDDAIVRRVSFPAPTEMIQTDMLTNTQHVFRRVEVPGT